VFKKFDLDDTQTISEENFIAVMKKLGKNVSPETAKEVMSEVELSTPGFITFDEFKRIMLPNRDALPIRVDTVNTLEDESDYQDLH
jgi:Ca2+-binding EF-hand superfamily protein